MDINDFQKHAVSTLAVTRKDISALSHRGFGLAGESGEVVQIIKKVIRDKDGVATDEDVQQIKKRLGDMLYYAAVLAEYYNLELSDVAADNMRQSTEFKEARRQDK